MTVHRIDPLDDSRWAALVAEHPDASVFHSPGWLRALRRTYRFRPMVLTTASPGQPLEDAVLLCRVDSRLTGRRLVSVPFADHCQPFWGADAGTLIDAVAEEGRSSGCRYVELRPVRAEGVLDRPGFGCHVRYAHHTIDLSPDLDQLRGAVHRSSVHQRINRAQRDGVVVRRGNSAELHRQFYSLLLKTRRKHGIPPQPQAWFANLADELGPSVTFHVASHDGEPVAAIVTTSFGDVHCYKYGCSDPARSRVSGTQLLLWQAIEAAKDAGARMLDMGRTDLANDGLRQFKLRWGATEHALEYHRAPPPTARAEDGDRLTGVAGHVFSRMPDSLLAAAGRHLYRHVA